MTRSKTKKTVFGFLWKSVAALLILVGVALISLMFVPAEKIAGIAASRFEAATGRAMVLEGAVRPSIWPQLGVKLGRVQIANAPWSDGGPMLDAESLAVGVDLKALIGGDIKITDVEVVAPKILLEIGPDGRGNWELGEDSGAAAGSGGNGVPTFTLDRADITDGQITFVDRRSGEPLEVAALNAAVTLPEFSGPAKVTVSARVNGQAVTLDAVISEFAAFLGDGSVPVTLAAEIGSSTVSFDGSAGLTPLAGTGALEADLGDMAGVFAALGQARPDLLEGLGRRVSVSGEVAYADNLVTLRDSTIQLDSNRLAGAVDLALGGKPRLTGEFTAGALDLSNLAGSDDGGDEPGDSGWSKANIDVSGLGALDAEVAIEADSVMLGPSSLGRTRIFALLEDSRAEVQIRELKAYDGAVDGVFVVNGRKGLSVRADLKGRAIALKPLLAQLAGYDRLIAAGDMEIDVTGSGGSMFDIMHSLNGKGAFRMGAGELLGLDLVGMLRNLDASFVGEGVKTIFDSITGTFRIENGVLINENLVLNSPLLSAVGAGEIGLWEQTLNYQLTPELLAGEGKGLRVPVRITGTWAKPKFQIDFQALAGEKLEAQKALVEEKAREAVRKKVEEELGTTTEEGQSAEDLLKKKATDALKNLLGGN